ncbi:MAG: hypothetical protein B7Y79_00165 [Rhodospirillales bacterium 35-44-4]|nr:MAG: hypothetical protein B7Y79_00165 [Rhodospirillales bacterium 35-44-4]
MKTRFLLAAATWLVLPVIAHAQPVTGPYVSLGGGASILNPVSYNLTGYNQVFASNGTTYFGRYQTRPADAFEASIGYGFGNGFRLEAEINYFRNTAHADDATSTTSGVTSSDGHFKTTGAEQTYGGMVNALYDISVGLPVFPYVGVGVGYEESVLASKFQDSYQGLISGHQGSFAYQVIAGLSYPIAAVPGLSLTGEYRFEQMVQSRSFIETYQGTSYKDTFGQQSSHTFLIGLRYQIFAPPIMAPAPAAAPMAAPAPAPAKTYLVFFDWNKYDLTPRATQIIAEAASDSKTTKITTINVSGYTDTSGTPTYNQGLSIRRAKAVAVKLMADGVPAAEISIHGFGDTHLLVPTGPGVREPQNRRVEIVLN